MCGRLHGSGPEFGWSTHDFFGFPDDLFAMEYPAPGAPGAAAEVEEIAKPTCVVQDVDSWGIDHGTWSVLAHMFPAADIPVVQLSITTSSSVPGSPRCARAA